jgi:hypothetical protein
MIVQRVTHAPALSRDGSRSSPLMPLPSRSRAALCFLSSSGAKQRKGELKWETTTV